MPVDPALGTVHGRKTDIDGAFCIFQSFGSRPDLGHDVLVLGLAGLEAAVEQPDFHEKSSFVV
jgi:hypothetical protein